MTSLTHAAAETTTWTSVRTEVFVARLSLSAIGLHLVDDNFLQPEPGISPFDHLVSGLLPLAFVVAAALLYGWRDRCDNRTDA